MNLIFSQDILLELTGVCVCVYIYIYVKYETIYSWFC